MSAYLISLCRQVNDRKRLEDYWANVAPAFIGVEAKPLAGTESAVLPFWSPDSRFVVFSASRKIRKADIGKGVSVDICDKPVPPVGGPGTATASLSSAA